MYLHFLVNKKRVIEIPETGVTYRYTINYPSRYISNSVQTHLLTNKAETWSLIWSSAQYPMLSYLEKAKALLGDD